MLSDYTINMTILKDYVMFEKENLMVKRAILAGVIFFIMIGCEGKSDEIAKIPEASGICFSPKSKTLFVVSDKGVLYEIAKDGKILQKERIGHYDLEGVACDDKNDRLLLVDEGKDNLLIIGRKNFKLRKKLNIRREYKGEMLLKKDKHHGLEGIALYLDKVLLANQSNKKYPAVDPSIIVQIDANVSRAKVPIEQIYNPHKKDISGLCYHDNYLYMVSDNKDNIIKYDLKTQKVIMKVKLPIFAQEGVAFDDEGYVYFADDDGAVFKFKKEKFGL